MLEDHGFSYGFYCLLVGGGLLAYSLRAGRLPVPFVKLSSHEMRLWFWANVLGQVAAILIGLYLVIGSLN